MAPMSREWPGISLSGCNFFKNCFLFSLPPSLFARRWSCSVWSKSLTFNPWLPSLPSLPHRSLLPLLFLIRSEGGLFSRRSAWWTRRSCRGRGPWSRSSRPRTSRRRSSWSRRWWRLPGTKARPPCLERSRRWPPLQKNKREEVSCCELFKPTKLQFTF